jgi:hypothetical protein
MIALARSMPPAPDAPRHPASGVSRCATCGARAAGGLRRAARRHGRAAHARRRGRGAGEGLGHTGDSRFQGLWTLLHGPVIGLPTSRRTRGLPVGIQPVVPNAAHGRLLAVTQWLAPALGPSTARGSGP